MGTLVCKCGKELTYEARHAGKKVRCGGCSKVLVVPEDVEEIEEVEEVEEVPPPRKRPRRDDDEDEPPRKAKRAARDEDDRPRRSRDEEEEDEDEDERPRKRKKPKAEPNAFAAMLTSVPGRWTLAIVGILGVVGVVMGWREGALASNSSATPQQITLSDLLAKGPGNNLHVILTGFESGNNYVSLSRNNVVESIYVPLMPAGAAGPQPTRLILMSRNARDPSSLQGRMGGGRVQGLLVNSVQSIDNKVSDLLRQSYPGIDMNTVFILEEGRAPMSRGLALALMIGGAVLLVGALGLGLFALLFGGVFD